MTAYLKSNAPLELKESLAKLEEQSDGCCLGLSIYNVPKNVANWAILALTADLIENAAKRHGSGSNRHLESITNLGRAAARALEWIAAQGKQAVRLKSALRLTTELREAAEKAVMIAHNYLTFVSNCSLWHRDAILAEVTIPGIVRFINVGGEIQRRVRAYQQGVRPPGSLPTTDHPAPPPISDVRISARIVEALELSEKKGSARFVYLPPVEIWRATTSIYAERLTALFRRDLKLSLGSFTLEEFRRFFAALLGICAVHENLCYRWSVKHGEYPADSAVLTRRTHEWVGILSELSGLSVETTETIIQSMIAVGVGVKPVDLHIHPFVPAGDMAGNLYLVPHFPIHARPDENALRLCSYLNPQAYDATSVVKENETLADLHELPSKFLLKGPIHLPNNLPNIDLIVDDPVSKSLAIVELKWIRKTVRAVEHIRADEHLQKGMQQLSDIRDFLLANPTYLADRRIVGYELTSTNTRFLLVARDHFRSLDLPTGVEMVAYDPFKQMLLAEGDLNTGIKRLANLDWLPLEGRDFEVKFQVAEANGARIEAEFFHPQ